MDDTTTSGRAIGGRARAESLTPDQRTQIAKRAAKARWDGPVVAATHGDPDHPLKIGDLHIPCYVLEDGRRVLSQAGMVGSLGMVKGGSSRGGDRLVKFATGNRLKQYLPKHLADGTLAPIRFRPPNGPLSLGYEATLLPDLCEAVLAARKAGALQQQQMHIADQCEILVRGLARVGIIALIDEATGYQDARARDALAKILEQFVAKEFRKWVRAFPIEYYRELCRIRNVAFPTGKSLLLPSYFGHLTNDLIYARLAPGVLSDLRRKNPTVKPGRRKRKLFQWLTEDVGDPRLREHLWKVITLLQVFDDWDQFYRALDRILPKFSDRPLLALMENDARLVSAIPSEP